MLDCLLVSNRVQYRYRKEHLLFFNQLKLLHKNHAKKVAGTASKLLNKTTSSSTIFYLVKFLTPFAVNIYNFIKDSSALAPFKSKALTHHRTIHNSYYCKFFYPSKTTSKRAFIALKSCINEIASNAIWIRIQNANSFHNTSYWKAINNR